MKFQLLLLFVFLLPCITFAQNEDKVKAILKEGIALHDAGKYDEAIKVYEKGLDIAPKSQLLYYEIAYANYAKGDYKMALKKSKKALKLKGNNKEDVYIILGNVQDVLGKSKKAVKTYKKGIKEFPNNYLLHYNLGLTSFNLNDLEQTEKALLDAVALNPWHTSSHYLLGFTKMNQEQNVQALLALTFFLLLEPDSKRSETALFNVERILGVGEKSKKNNTIYLNANALKSESSFATAEMMLSISSAAIKGEIDSTLNLTEEEKFYSGLENIYTFLKESKEGKEGFWWNFYVELYTSLLDENHFETFCYFITQIKEGEVYLWMEKNDDKIQAMINFLNEG